MGSVWGVCRGIWKMGVEGGRVWGRVWWGKCGGGWGKGGRGRWCVVGGGKCVQVRVKCVCVCGRAECVVVCGVQWCVMVQNKVGCRARG